MPSVESFGVPARKAHRKLEQDTRVSALRKVSKRDTKQSGAHGNPNKPLTGQQKLFIKYHAEGDTILNAAHRAGFSPAKYGYTILNKANAQAYLKKMQAEYAAAAEMSRKDVMDMLKESYEMARLMSEPATMVSAAREIGKMCGFYEPKKIQLDLTVNGATKFEQLTDAQLFAMIDQAAADAIKAETQEQALLEAPDTDEDDVQDAEDES